MIAHAVFNPSIWEAKAGIQEFEGSLAYKEFQATKGYTVRLCLERKKKNLKVDEMAHE